MNASFRMTAAATLLACALTLPLRADDTPGLVEFGKFVPPEGNGQFVEVNIKSALISMVARLAERYEPEAASVLRGLKSVRVNVVGMDDANREQLTDKVRKVRNELDTTGWERLVTVQDKGEDVSVYLKQRGDEAIEGIVVMVLDGKKEAVFVNIVGDIRPDKIALVAEKLEIPPLKHITAKLKKS